MRSFDPDTRLTMIQSLIPLGLAAVCDALQEEVQAFAARATPARAAVRPTGAGAVSKARVYLADQRTAVQVPRVRDTRTGNKVKLSTYQQFQQPDNLDETLFHRDTGYLR